MFYSQFILAKKGPLGTIWIAAHLERKLRKNQVADTDIGVSVDSILFPEMPIALRLSSHLLLGVVRIYNKKVNYLFDDCSEALLKIKQAFRSTAVDLPPEESKAPYHSITLPETFDLDDFELPDNDLLQGNYVDHHISSREQITLQDSMEGISYSTSKFGLDERFGDGDASGLDLDEELFLDKFGTTDNAEDHADERVEPQASVGSITAVKHGGLYENKTVNLENKVDGVDEFTDLMDYAHAPCTPGLVEDPNFSNVREASAGDDHLDTEYQMMESATRENSKNIVFDSKQDLEWCSPEVKNSGASYQVPPEENVRQSSALEIEVSKPPEKSPSAEANMDHVSLNESSCVCKPIADLPGQVNATIPVSEFRNSITASDVRYREDIQNEAGDKDKPHSILLDDPCGDHQASNKFGSEKSACGISVSTSTSQGTSVKDQPALVVEVPGHEKLLVNPSKFLDENESGSLLEKPVTEDYPDPTDSSALNVPENLASSETVFLRPCNLNLERPDTTNSGCCITDANAQSNNAALPTSGTDTITVTAPCSCRVHIFSRFPVIKFRQELEANHVEELASCKDIHATSGKSVVKAHNSNSPEMLEENLNNMEESLMPAPEKLLAVPDGHAYLHRDMLEDVTLKEFEVLDECDTGSKIITGKKRSFTESTLTEQSLNSVESSRLVRVKRTAESIPDDDDLLSSILVGRRSSVFKVKPTPPFSEVTSMKRTRSAPRSGPPKRKVLMDDVMVLHGDTIRQQLTNTEDIRRVRKKAPCTRPEVSMIQKQSLEDEIFLDAILIGMSLELAPLHRQVIDLTGIRVIQNEENVVSLENVAESRLASQNLGNGFPVETLSEPKLASDNGKNDVSLETAVESLLTPQYTEIGTSIGMENDKRFSGTYVAEQSALAVNCEGWLVRDNEMSVPIENPLPIDNRLGEAFDSLKQNNAANDVETVVSQQECFINEADQETTEKDADVVNTDVITELKSIGHTDMNDDMSGMVKTNLDETCEKNSFINIDIDVSNALIEQRIDASSVEMDKEIMDFDHKQTIGGDEIPAKDEIINEESSHFDVDDRGESNYMISGNDTEFLNVDDDELAEIADDYPLDTEEARLTENSGWSSRTRAVSKYLQMMFFKEAECGRQSLSMDNLLIGKSRKEASRMFFEALVLKTRDYIHVEQHIPLSNITIKPRMRLMKSDF